jgi:hypothetical protein
LTASSAAGEGTLVRFAIVDAFATLAHLRAATENRQSRPVR